MLTPERVRGTQRETGLESTGSGDLAIDEGPEYGKRASSGPDGRVERGKGQEPADQ